MQSGATFPIEILPTIPPVAPDSGGPARGARYPPGETMKPATVDAVVRKRNPRIKAELFVTSMILCLSCLGFRRRLSLRVRTTRSVHRTSIQSYRCGGPESRRKARRARTTFRGRSISPGTARLSSYPSSYYSSVPISCILSFAIKIVNLRLSSSGLSLGGLGHRRTRSMVEVLAGSRSRPWLQVSRLELDSSLGRLVA